ncbi:GNAT family N-acetyltransferase [Streptomyces sp. NPDC005125]
MTERPLVPHNFPVPLELQAPGFRLEPIRPEHNARDYAAWTSSIEHIRATPGFATDTWFDMTLDQNLADLTLHADHFARRIAFTYTVLEESTDDIIGCVYVFPASHTGYDADVSSWVRADRAALDGPVYESVRDWLAACWPFRHIAYAPRMPGSCQPPRTVEIF